MVRYDFEAHNVNRMIWISGKINSADPLTRRASPMNQAVNLCFTTDYSVKILIKLVLVLQARFLDKFGIPKKRERI